MTLVLGLAAKAAVAVVAVGAVGGATAMGLVASSGAPPARPPGTLVTKVVDGDTLEIASGDRVRLIGIDTPELGTCGYQAATDAMRDLVEGQRVSLENPTSVQETDSYGRLLRYVDREATDTGYHLLRAGLAKARYDSQDGFDPHPREDDYRASDETTTSRCEEAMAERTEQVEQEWRDANAAAAQAGIDARPGEGAAHLLDRARTKLREQRRVGRQQDRQEERQRERQQERQRERQQERQQERKEERLRQRQQEQRQEERRQQESSQSNPPGSTGGDGYTGCREYAPGGLTWEPIPC